MPAPEALCEIWRGSFLESLHMGHAVICDETGQIVKSWGDPDAVILPRSSAKMIQALPLLSSGAGDHYGLTEQDLALTCASHQGGQIHTSRVSAWLQALGYDQTALRCGAQPPRDRDEKRRVQAAQEAPCQIHNNCSGKHTGFLTLGRFLKGDDAYTDIAHPVQRACLEAFEQVTDAASPGHAIDGCSAPNFATSLLGLARAMAWFASAEARIDGASQAALRLRGAMAQYPDLVAGEGRACTELMQAMQGGTVVKTGAEGVFVAIIPQKRFGIAVKILDGSTRASECAIAALLCALGALPPAHPATLKRMHAPIVNWSGLHTGEIRPAPGLTL